MNYTPKSQWEYIYQTIPVAQIPWETGKPSEDLLRLFDEKILKKGVKVLDVGCGLGTQTRFIAKKGLLATGIDISETAIARAREQILKESIAKERFADEMKSTINFVVGDVTKMPFPNGSFEFIYDRGCYHHLNATQRRNYAKEASRVLIAGGQVHILAFAGTVSASEIITHFLDSFVSQGGYEDIVFDHTNNQEITVHVVRFKKSE